MRMLRTSVTSVTRSGYTVPNHFIALIHPVEGGNPWLLTPDSGESISEFKENVEFIFDEDRDYYSHIEYIPTAADGRWAAPPSATTFQFTARGNGAFRN